MVDGSASERIKQERTDELWRATQGHGQAWNLGA